MSETIPDPAAPEPSEAPAPEQQTEGQLPEPVIEAPAEPKPEKTPAWLQKRLAEMARAKGDAERRAELAERALKERQTASGDPSPAQPQDFERAVDARARAIAEAAAFDAECNRTYEAGKKDFADFDTAVEGHKLLGGIESRRDYVEAINSLPNGHAVFHHLGTHLDDAARILELPPVRMAIELAKLSGSVGKQKPAVSNAPAPIKPVGGSARPEANIETMSMKDFAAMRARQIEERRNRR